MSKAPKNADDTAEVILGAPAPPTQPPSVDPAVLRRALKYGQKARDRFPNMSFHDAETQLRDGWVKKGEATEWDWVRAAVRAGFEQSPDSE